MYHDDDLQTKHDNLFRKSILQPLEPVLPPFLSEIEFHEALNELTQAIGKDRIVTGEALFNYVDPFEQWEGLKRNLASAAVCPDSTDQVQKVLRIANRYRIPLWTVSRGKNLGYGGPAPRVRGSVILDLHLMSRIIEVNEKFAFAVVEPGVTFFELFDYCRKHSLGVWPSVPSLGWGSIVGNTLDRGFGYTPMGDHHNQICGMEVVLSNGDVIRTGQFGISNGQVAHLSKLSFGPSIEGLFLQSNLGIVTKLGIWLYPQVQSFMSCSLDMENPEDIGAMVEVLSTLRRADIIQNNPVVRNIVAWYSMIGARHDLWKEAGPVPMRVWKELQKKMDVGYWMARFGLYGPERLVQERFNHIKEVVSSRLPRARLSNRMFHGENGALLDAATVPATMGGGQVGVPDMWTLPSLGYRCGPNGNGVGAHTDFSPILPASGEEVLAWFRIAKQITEAYGFDIYCGGHLHGRSMILISMMLFNKADAVERAAVDAIFQDLVREAKVLGISKYRSHINHMDLVADMYDFNNHAYRRFVEGLKEKLDPNGILSPGKQGIWSLQVRSKL